MEKDLRTKKKDELKKKFEEIDSNLFNNQKEELISKLRKQMEFYLGDSNLLKDHFLRELMMKDKKNYIELKFFLNCNKIKGFLLNIDDKKKKLIEAIELSPLLKINKSKTKVKRKVKLETNENTEMEIDKRTIYVENLAENVKHENLAEIFSKVGKIKHISLPKYSETKISKGFAFIEFSVKIFLHFLFIILF